MNQIANFVAVEQGWPAEWVGLLIPTPVGWIVKLETNGPTDGVTEVDKSERERERRRPKNGLRWRSEFGGKETRGGGRELDLNFNMIPTYDISS